MAAQGGTRAILVPVESGVALAGAIGAMLDGREMAARMAAAGRAHFEARFSAARGGGGVARVLQHGGEGLMCGIAGMAMAPGVAPDGDALARMVTALHHRGPDGSGTVVRGAVALAHTRLADYRSCLFGPAVFRGWGGADREWGDL